MFRAKNYLVVTGVLLVLTGAVYWSLKSVLTDNATREVETQLARDQKLMSQVTRLEGIDFVNLAMTFAQEQEFLRAIALPDPTERRSRLFVAVEARNARLGHESRKADLIAVTDATGRVLVRDLDPNIMYGSDLKAQYPAVGLALAGTPNKDIWTFNGRPMRVAAAPLRAGEGQQVHGALLIGFVMTDKEARHKRELFGSDVAYVLDHRIVASSFVSGGEGEGAREDVQRAKTLAARLFDTQTVARSALDSGRTSDPISMTLGGEDVLITVQPWVGNSFSKTAGVVLMQSLSQALRPVVTVQKTILVFGLLVLIVALGGLILASRRFMGPLDQLENGAAEVINGNLDYQFAKPSPDYEGLANSLNVMLARLLGRPEPGEEEDGDQAAQAAKSWRADNLFEDVQAISTTGSAAVTDPGTLQLAQEPVDAYYKRTYDEYIAAKKKAGESIDGVSLDSFRAKLSQNETVLRAKYKCKLVRFRVVVKDKQVTLKPVPIY